MASELIIGAPVHQRAWILPTWFDHLSRQELPEDVEFVFNYGLSQDATIDTIMAKCHARGWHVTVAVDPADDHHAERKWNLPRYATMVRLRNRLLEIVRRRAPRYYLSLDTDILLPPGAIPQLRKELEAGQWDGIAPMTWMTRTGGGTVNAMYLGGATRPKVRGELTQQVEACFGAVLMDTRLYRDVDYAVHHSGEDLGWAQKAATAGMRLAICPGVKAKHVMDPADLTVVDERVGW